MGRGLTNIRQNIINNTQIVFSEWNLTIVIVFAVF